MTQHFAAISREAAFPGVDPNSRSETKSDRTRLLRIITTDGRNSRDGNTRDREKNLIAAKKKIVQTNYIVVARARTVVKYRDTQRRRSKTYFPARAVAIRSRANFRSISIINREIRSTQASTYPAMHPRRDAVTLSPPFPPRRARATRRDERQENFRPRGGKTISSLRLRILSLPAPGAPGCTF